MIFEDLKSFRTTKRFTFVGNHSLPSSVRYGNLKLFFSPALSFSFLFTIRLVLVKAKFKSMQDVDQIPFCLSFCLYYFVNEIRFYCCAPFSWLILFVLHSFYSITDKITLFSHSKFSFLLSNVVTEHLLRRMRKFINVIKRGRRN